MGRIPYMRYVCMHGVYLSQNKGQYTSDYQTWKWHTETRSRRQHFCSKYYVII